MHCERQSILVVLVRTDIKMGLGKIAAQTGHAVLGAFLKARDRAEAQDNVRQAFTHWMGKGQQKKVLRVQSLEQLRERLEAARSKGIVVKEIADAGRTEVEPGTVTVGAIGPWWQEDIGSCVAGLQSL